MDRAELDTLSALIALIVNALHVWTLRWHLDRMGLVMST